VILADTSAWVEFLRGTQHPIVAEMRRAARADELILTEPVLMELLAGMPSDGRAATLDATLSRYLVAPVGGAATYRHAATIGRACRQGGQAVRSSIDCLIAAVAIRVGAALLHNDRDFDVIARHAPLRILQVGA
jgi:predicted nucleic acid-binding protein